MYSTVGGGVGRELLVVVLEENYLRYGYIWGGEH
jgi:hypothetical protein